MDFDNINNTERETFNGLFLMDFYIPEELLVHILSFVDAEDLLNCRSVCKYWKEAIDNCVWKHKVSNAKYVSLSNLTELEKSRLQIPWRLYYIVCTKDPFNKNLLKNNCGQARTAHWTITSGDEMNDDRGWNVESIPIGSDSLPSGCGDFDGHTSCFVTSYNSCEKNQTVDLFSCGLTSGIMDNYQPVIVASEWYAGRYDCPCKYKLKVYLCDSDCAIISKKQGIRAVAQWAGKEWNKVEISFENYGPGVRYVRFNHKGHDTHWWRGHYGSKMSGAVVKLLFPTHSVAHFEKSSSDE